MSQATPRISVILPAYQCGLFLPQAIDSILTQTVADFELLIVYDPSSDDTLEVIESYRARDARIHVLHGKQERLVGALNLGLNAARGQFIARMDADDISLPERFALQLEQMERDQLDFCGCDMAMMNEIGRPINSVVMPATPELITITLACTVPFAHGSVMMRRAFLDQHQLRYQVGAAAEDYQFWCKAFSQGARFGNVSQLVFQYRHLAQSLSKVHAKVVARHTHLLRRDFVRHNSKAIGLAIEQILAKRPQLTTKDASFVLLAAYMVSAHIDSDLLWKVLKSSNIKTIALSAAKLLRGF